MDQQQWQLEVSECLGRLEEKQDTTQRDILEVKEIIKPLPVIKEKLNNHLTWHENRRIHILWPILVGISVIAAGYIFAYVIH